MRATIDERARGRLSVAAALATVLATAGLGPASATEPGAPAPPAAQVPVPPPATAPATAPAFGLPAAPNRPAATPTPTPTPAPAAAQPAAPKPGVTPPAPAPAGVPPPAPPVAATSVEGQAAADAAPSRVISMRGDRLTVRVTDVALDEVLRGIVAESKAEIKGAVKDPHPVTADFADVPLQDGLTRILGEQNFLLTYREDGSLRTLTLLGGPVEETNGGAQVVGAGPGPAPTPEPTPTDLLQRSVPVTGKLQQFLGQPTATMQQLMDITLRQEDAGLRLEAMRTGMNAIDSQPDMRAAVVKSLEGVEDQVLETMVRNLAQDHAQEFVSQMAATSRTPEIRTRGLRILRTLNETPGSVAP